MKNMKKPNIQVEEYAGSFDSREIQVGDVSNPHVIAKSYGEMMDALIKVQALWWNEVYEFGLSKYEGDEDKAEKLADNDAQNVVMVKALKKAGCKE